MSHEIVERALSDTHNGVVTTIHPSVDAPQKPLAAPAVGRIVFGGEQLDWAHDACRRSKELACRVVRVDNIVMVASQESP